MFEFCVRFIGLIVVFQRGGLAPVAGFVYAASILEQYTFASGARNMQRSVRPLPNHPTNGRQKLTQCF
eukprot:5125098-Amphidinium_carterae.1